MGNKDFWLIFRSCLGNYLDKELEKGKLKLVIFNFINLENNDYISNL